MQPVPTFEAGAVEQAGYLIGKAVRLGLVAAIDAAYCSLTDAVRGSGQLARGHRRYSDE